MSSRKLSKSYVSGIDEFLGVLDAKFVRSESQNEEARKAERIKYLSTHVVQNEFQNKETWENF